jgi:threonine/homoserine/homoserine lactone efflux protein
MSIYAKLASYATRQFDQFSRKINLVIGIIFLGLGVLQTIQVL